ncbi:MAG TPA: transcriptional regulator [Microscillaceae bacterium]|jgi:DNA-binding transcriptional ArsR family regulator|nr:transcriptional regulator [Microscillaceae bacterium]
MFAKVDRFDETQQQLALFAKSLSHPARIAIVQLLAAQKTCISGDIAAALPLSRATVSQHLQELKKVGLIKGEIDGQHVNYCLDVSRWKLLVTCFGEFFTQTDPPNDCTC